MLCLKIIVVAVPALNPLFENCQLESSGTLEGPNCAPSLIEIQDWTSTVHSLTLTSTLAASNCMIPPEPFLWCHAYEYLLKKVFVWWQQFDDYSTVVTDRSSWALKFAPFLFCYLPWLQKCSVRDFGRVVANLKCSESQTDESILGYDPTPRGIKSLLFI